MKAKPTYLVTFRNSYDKLTCMLAEKFTSVKDAKAAIECDGAAFRDAHDRADEHYSKHRSSAKWIEPKLYDYYEVKGRDGQSCVWQYFKI